MGPLTTQIVILDNADRKEERKKVYIINMKNVRHANDSKTLSHTQQFRIIKVFFIIWRFCIQRALMARYRGDNYIMVLSTTARIQTMIRVTKKKDRIFYNIEIFIVFIFVFRYLPSINICCSSLKRNQPDIIFFAYDRDTEAERVRPRNSLFIFHIFTLCCLSTSRCNGTKQINLMIKLKLNKLRITHNQIQTVTLLKSTTDCIPFQIHSWKKYSSNFCEQKKTVQKEVVLWVKMHQVRSLHCVFGFQFYITLTITKMFFLNIEWLMKRADHSLVFLFEWQTYAFAGF